MREQTSQASEINISVVKVIYNTNKNDVIYLEVSNKLYNLKNDNIQSTIQRTSESDTVRMRAPQD